MTLLGTTVSQSSATDSYHQEFSRSGDYPVEASEARVGQILGQADFRYQVAPRTYTFIDNAFPPNGKNSRPNRDAAQGRLNIVSWKSNPYTWAQASGGTAAVNTLIRQRGFEAAAWLDSHPGCNLIVSIHHEPNGDEAVAGTSGTTNAATGRANWRAFLENLWTIFTQECGVPVWVGAQDGSTTQFGAILSGANIADGAYAFTNSMQIFNDWYPESWAWGWDNIQMASFDAYVSGPNAGEQFRAIEEIWGALAARPGCKLWMRTKVAAQNARGKVLLPSCWEWGVQERNQVNSNGAKYGQTSTYWTNTYGNPVTKAAWLAHAADWLLAHWPGLHSMVYWDFIVSPANFNPWMVDLTQASFQAWAQMTQHELFHQAPVDPDPDPDPDPIPGAYHPGAIPLGQRMRMISP